MSKQMSGAGNKFKNESMTFKKVESTSCSSHNNNKNKIDLSRLTQSVEREIGKFGQKSNIRGSFINRCPIDLAQFGIMPRTISTIAQLVRIRMAILNITRSNISARIKSKYPKLQLSVLATKIFQETWKIRYPCYKSLAFKISFFRHKQPSQLKTT